MGRTWTLTGNAVATFEIATAKHRCTACLESVMSRTRRLPPATPVATLAPLRPLLMHWLCVGLALVILLPAARSYSMWIGWLPYWLVAAPLLCLGIIDGVPKLSAVRTGWTRRSGAKLVSGRAKGQRRQQNRRLAFSQTSTIRDRRAGLVALLNGNSTLGV